MRSTGYDAAAQERWVQEPPKSSARSPFERDRARLVHSSALRRLAAKTQVVGPQSDDFVRNRLTHTLEVAQVARDLGRRLGCDADVVECAALAHDIGHPPFGHNGEAALADLADVCGGFEGNAQTFRILTRLEAKTEAAGLNLTRAALDAATKYPWPRSDRDPAKYGVYDDDREIFDWVRQGPPPRQRCVEAQVMDVADDVAYSVHDFEDALVAGRIHPELLADPGAQRDIIETARTWYLPTASPEALLAAYRELAQLPLWPTARYDGSRRAQAALKNLTSDLIGRFCAEVQLATHRSSGRAAVARYAAEVVVPPSTLMQIVVLKGVAAHFVMQASDRLAVQERQREMLGELYQALVTGGPELLEPIFRADFAAASDDAGRQRVLIDQLACLTDASAEAWHRRLCAANARVVGS